MKKLYFLALLFLFVGCDKDNHEVEFREIEIKNIYPYSNDKVSLANIDEDKFELFNQKIFLVNSVSQLTENALFTYIPDLLKVDLTNFDFEKYSLILTSSSTINEFESIKSFLRYDNVNKGFEYTQTFYSKPLTTPVENVNLVLLAFCINKIEDNSQLLFSKAVMVI